MAREYCLRCEEQVEVIDGRCPEGHEVATEDLGPKPWIGQAMSHLDNTGEQSPPASDDDSPVAVAESSDAAPDPQDELAALLADLEHGGGAIPADETEPSEVPATDDAGGDDLQSAADALASMQEPPGAAATEPETQDEPDEPPADEPPAESTAAPASELETLARELAGSEHLTDSDDDGLGPLDESIAAWDAEEATTVAPQADPDDLSAMSDDELAALFDDGDDAPDDELAAVSHDAPPPPEPVADPPAETAPTEPAPLDPPPPPPHHEEPVGTAETGPEVEDAPDEPAEPDSGAIDLTNFTAAGRRVDTSSKPPKRRGLFGFGR